MNTNALFSVCLFLRCCSLRVVKFPDCVVVSMTKTYLFGHYRDAFQHLSCFSSLSNILAYSLTKNKKAHSRVPPPTANLLLPGDAMKHFKIFLLVALIVTLIGGCAKKHFETAVSSKEGLTSCRQLLASYSTKDQELETILDQKIDIFKGNLND